MRVYRFLWWSLAVPIGLLGLAAAIATSSVPTAAIVFGIMALCLGALSANLQSLDGEGTSSGPISMSVVVKHGCAAAAAVVALYGLSSLIGGGVIPLALVLGLTCPAMADRWRAGRRPQRPEQPGDIREEPFPASARDEPRPASADARGGCAPPTLEVMTCTELCMAWRRSFVELQRTESAETRSIIAAHRQQILDELERRNPDGFGDWLASGARAPSDPSKYLLDRPGGRNPSH
jgi:hypothetical protein